MERRAGGGGEFTISLRRRRQVGHGRRFDINLGGYPYTYFVMVKPKGVHKQY